MRKLAFAHFAIVQRPFKDKEPKDTKRCCFWRGLGTGRFARHFMSLIAESRLAVAAIQESAFVSSRGSLPPSNGAGADEPDDDEVRVGLS